MGTQVSTPILIHITDLDALRDVGIYYPRTVDGWRWLFRTRHERGLERAFLRVGRRIVVDVPVFLEVVRANDRSLGVNNLDQKPGALAGNPRGNSSRTVPDRVVGPIR